MDRIVVTGIGVISAIGSTVAENRLSLMNGICGMGTLQSFSSKYADILPVAEVKMSTQELKEKFNTNQPGTTRAFLLSIQALEEALTDSQLSKHQIEAADTAFISANTVGGMCYTDEMYEDSKEGSPASEYIAAYDCSVVNIQTQKRYQLNGPVNTINTACSSSANAIMYGARLIKTGRANRAIVGGVDSLAKFTINGFNALHILSPTFCTPFDENRKGLNLGEGAAFIVLEKESDVINKKIYASLSGYANANDAYHASSLSDEGHGPYKAMQEALNLAKLNVDQIDFINAHGTATENNDKVESMAMIRLFKKVPLFTSTKANTGHTLGAAGAMEAVFCILNLFEQELYPAINFNTPIIGVGLKPNLEYKKTALNHIMSNSFGFGGNCSSLIFSKA